MLYERSADSEGEKPPPRRLRIIAACALVVALGTIAGVLASTLGSSSANAVQNSPAALAAGRAFLQANTLIDNLGAPAPQGELSGEWALTGDPLVGAPGHQHLALPEQHWYGSVSAPVALAAPVASMIERRQQGLIGTLMSGGLRSDTDHDLATIVRGERALPPTISSPGGASIVKWFARRVQGNNATVEAIVSVWSQVDTYSRGDGSVTLDRAINVGELDAKAVLQRRGGRWRLVSLARPPYQEAT